MKVYLVSPRTRNGIYHTDKDCHVLKDKVIEKDLDKLQGQFKRCKICSDGVKTPTNAQGRTTCPRCGQEFKNLPKHLPTCDG